MDIYNLLSPQHVPIRESSNAVLESIPYSTSLLVINRRSVDNPELIASIPRHQNKIATLVLDLDETLVKYSQNEGRLYVRPYTREMLQCFEEKLPELEIIVWSAGHRDHVDRVLDLLDPSQKLVSHAICRGHTWMNSAPVFKNISRLDRERTIIVDDSIYASAANGSRAIIIPEFLPKHPFAAIDTTLLYVLQVVSRAVSLTSASLKGRDEATKAGIPSYWDSEAHTLGVKTYGVCNPSSLPAVAIGKSITDDPSSVACLLVRFVVEHPFIAPYKVNNLFYGILSYEKLDVADSSKVGGRIALFRKETSTDEIKEHFGWRQEITTI